MNWHALINMTKQILSRITADLSKQILQTGHRLPFSGTAIHKRLLDKESRSILDMGCGPGEAATLLTLRKHYFTVGCDIYLPNLLTCKLRNSHDALIRCDIRFLPFRPKSFDIALCTEVIEHLQKEDGYHLIASLEEVARKQVIISTPVGFCHQTPQYGNLFEEHLSGYFPSEFRTMGYSIRGFYLPEIIGPCGILSRLPKLLRFALLAIVALFINPFLYYFPSFSGQMVCIKSLKNYSEAHRS